MSKKEEPIDLNPFLIIALSSKPHLYEAIHTIYKANEEVLYHTFRKSAYATHPFLTGYTTKRQEIIKQVIGIFENSIHDNDPAPLFTLIKKGYRFSYHFVVQRKDINLGEFNNHFRKKYAKLNKESYYTFSDLDYMSNLAVVIYLSNKLNKPLSIPNDINDYLQASYQNWEMNHLPLEKVLADNSNTLQIEKIASLKKRLAINASQKEIQFEEILGNLVDYEKDKLLENDRSLDLHQAGALAITSGVSKYGAALTHWLRLLGINDRDLEQAVVFSDTEIDQLLQAYLLLSTHYQADLNQTNDGFLMSFIYLWAIIKEYEETQNSYLENMKEEYFEERIRLEEKAMIQEQKIKETEKQLRAREQQLLLERERLEEENRLLQQQLKKASLELEQFTDHQKELTALRKFIFSQKQATSQAELDDSQPASDEKLSVVKSLKAAVIGGHPNWQKKLKHTLEPFIFIDTDDLNRDLQFLSELDAVIINTSYLSHAMYEKVMANISKQSVKLVFINSSGSVGQTINRVYQQITEGQAL